MSSSSKLTRSLLAALNADYDVTAIADVSCSSYRDNIFMHPLYLARCLLDRFMSLQRLAAETGIYIWEAVN
jgi:hypothetical protein